MEKTIKALEELFAVTTPQNLRGTILKLFFHRREGVANRMDEEEVYFILTFLEKIDQKKGPE